jgi:hypothetical protein
MKNVFNNKNILIFLNRTGFSLFEDCICQMESYGATVKVILRDSNHTTDIKSAGTSIFRIVNKLLHLKNDAKLTLKYIQQSGCIKYDYFITIGYYQVSSKFIKHIKRNNPNCRCIIYFYDSFCCLNFSNDIKLFDLCFTFDKEDAYNNIKLNYLPYFIYNKSNCSNNYKYDLCHIGVYSAGHLYRVPILEELKKQATQYNLSYFIKCYAIELDMNSIPVRRKISLLIRKLIVRDYILYFNFLRKYKDSDIFMKEYMPFEKIIDIENNSKCIIDINAHRSGLSPRIINALANHKKVIINTDSIKTDFFYSPNNVFILNEKNVTLDMDFLNKPIEYINMDSLLIPNWLLILIGEKPS